MKKLDDRKIFYMKTTSWRVPALVALIIALPAAVIQYHLSNILFLLFAASGICFVLLYRKYAVLNDQSINILFATHSQGIIISYNQIEAITSVRKRINGIFRIGGKIGNVPNCTKEVEYILISLKIPLEMQSLPIDIKNRELYIEDEKIYIDENGSEIILYKPPKGGFRPFLDALSNSVNVVNADMFEYENKYANYILEFLNFLWLSVIVILILFTLSNQ